MMQVDLILIQKYHIPNTKPQENPRYDPKNDIAVPKVTFELMFGAFLELGMKNQT